jgi:hypothetical protein
MVMRRRAGVAVALAGVLGVSAGAQAAVMTFNSPDHAGIATYRATWLAAVGIPAPAHLVDFESGFSNGQNVSGVTGLFPAGLVITDTDAGLAVVRSGAGSIQNSNPVGTYSLTQNEQPYLELDFSASPIDYLAFLDIDHTGTTAVVTFDDGSTVNLSIETTLGRDDSAEFYGIFRNDRPLIQRVQLDASGSQPWGVDNIEYGVVPLPATLWMLGSSLGFLGLRRRGGRAEEAA